MKRIAVFQDDLDVGGIQKSLVNLLNNLDYNRYSVDLYLFREGGFWISRVPQQVNIIYEKPMPGRYKYLPFDLALSAADFDFSAVGENYDLAVDFNSYQPWTAAGSILVPAEKRVLWVHNDVEIKFREEWKYRVLFRAMKGKYKYFEEFACVSEAIAEPFLRMTGVKDKKILPIPNYIDTAEIHERSREDAPDAVFDDDCFNLCAVGRLCHQKGYDIMLQNFAEAAKEREDLRLYIIGGGPDREKLEKQIAENALSDRVFLLGNRDNPFAYMQRCDGLISTSRYEGQGMNIMEAKALGLQIFIPEHLEKYVENISGCRDVTAALVAAKKAEKKFDLLEEYNAKTLAMVDKL